MLHDFTNTVTFFQIPDNRHVCSSSTILPSTLSIVKSLSAPTLNQDLKMALIHRTLLTWFLMLVLLILVGLRLDKRTNWNWFVVLIPAWMYSAFDLILISLYCVSDIRAANSNNEQQRQKVKLVLSRVFEALLTLLQLSFLVMLCINLNAGYPSISWFVVFTPLLAVMGSFCAYTFSVLIRPQYRD